MFLSISQYSQIKFRKVYIVLIVQFVSIMTGMNMISSFIKKYDIDNKSSCVTFHSILKLKFIKVYIVLIVQFCSVMTGVNMISGFIKMYDIDNKSSCVILIINLLV